ncbi:hypothetical protein AX17_007477 [Amanita inopinata Kibby_2008]|nr:hypothetical protein AX17_007477 [Amanita inopinata Kibby_2008]
MCLRLGTGIPDPIVGPKGIRLLLLFRGLSGFVGLFGIYYSLQYLSLSDATVLTFLTPLCTAVAGALFLRETFRRTQAFAGVVSLCGVVLIARPPFLFGNRDSASALVTETVAEIVTRSVSTSKGTPTERMIAVGVALFGVLGGTGAYTSIRAIGKRAHPLHTMAYFSSLCVVISTVGMIVTRTPFIIPPRLDWLALLLMIGIFGFLAQVLLTMGLQREAAGRASMAVYTQIVFATILERIFFHTSPSLLSAIGICMILSSALYVAVTKEKFQGPKLGPIHLEPDNDDELDDIFFAQNNAPVLRMFEDNIRPT